MIPVLKPMLSWSDLWAFLGFGVRLGCRFEQRLSEAFHVQYALTCSMGRAGLHNILKANEIEGRCVLVSAYTCCVVTEAISQSGNRNVFIDVEEGSFNMRLLKEHVELHRKDLGAVVITNLYGLPNDYDALEFLADRDGYLVIFDNALSPGEVAKIPRELYDYSIISCGVRKPFGCLGGGIIFCNDAERYEALRRYTAATRRKRTRRDVMWGTLFASLFFIAFRPFVYSITSLVRRKTSLLNSLFDEVNHDIHAVNTEYDNDMRPFQKRIGLNQLRSLGRQLTRRSEIAGWYYELLEGHYEWVQRYWTKDAAYSHLPFLAEDRGGLESFLHARGIDTERYFDYAIPDIETYSENGDFPNARFVARRVLNLPIHAHLRRRDVEEITGWILQYETNLENTSRN